MAFRIPELAAGVVGATTLNLYSDAVNDLLGLSHAAYGLEGVPGSYSTTSTSATTKETRYQYQIQPTFYYVIALKIPDGETATCTFRDVGASADLGTVTSTSATWELKAGTIDLTAHIAAEGYVEGDILTIAARLHTSDVGSAASLYVFSYGERGVIAGWAVLPAFTDATQSAVADLNALRTDLNILQDDMVSPVNVLTRNGARVKTSAGTSSITVLRAAYRYRGDGLFIAIETKGGGGDGWKWQLLSYPASDPTDDTELYVSPDWIGANMDYEITTHALDLSAAGLTPGTWYMLRLLASRDDTYPFLSVRRAWLVRTSSGTAGGSWAVPNQFAVNDTDLGNTEGDKWTADLTELYTAGTEELWGETPAIIAAPGTVEGDRDDRTFTGVHRYRWLNVKAHSNEDPLLLYGTDFAEVHTFSVDADLTWQVYDLDATPLPLGGYYAVAQCDVAFESQEPCNNA